MVVYQSIRDVGSKVFSYLILVTRGLVTVVFPCAPAPTQTPSGISPWSPRYTRIFPLSIPRGTPSIPRGISQW